MNLTEKQFDALRKAERNNRVSISTVDHDTDMPVIHPSTAASLGKLGLIEIKSHTQMGYKGSGDYQYWGIVGQYRTATMTERGQRVLDENRFGPH